MVHSRLAGSDLQSLEKQSHRLAVVKLGVSEEKKSVPLIEDIIVKGEQFSCLISPDSNTQPLTASFKHC